jgi:hypothetical protein
MAIFNSYVELPEGICLVTLGYQRAKHTLRWGYETPHFWKFLNIKLAMLPKNIPFNTPVFPEESFHAIF